MEKYIYNLHVILNGVNILSTYLYDTIPNKNRNVELRGFEPRTFALPARRSSQLSYSPIRRVNI